ncbi:redoxin domain-containing protein [Halalkalibaculum sp. DA3122]|uniref:redoxin domain-containing protein n=1 Tax=Halalkalibaculum sp. DA3122 TaxID=3373607 RepID=UPI003754F58B
MALKEGNKAPNFVLQDTEGNEVQLSDFMGNPVVLLFFPLAFSEVCTRELCTARDNMKLFESLNAKILAISVDSFFTLKEFKRSHNINFTLLSDFNREVSQKYETLYHDYYGMKGVAKRSAHIVDSKGIIQYREVLDNSSELPDFDAIQTKLQELLS